jgi:4-diphosphocytidyl-2-C-methyl-D-erythritol kinase
MSYFKIRSHAKINLALNVVGKLKSLHKIESIVSFLNLHDIIKIRKIISKNHNIRFIGQFSNKIKTKNTISELLKNIDKKRLLKNKFEIIIKKNIPSEAGLGGGSMNAASVLNYFIKKKLIKIKKKQIEQLSYSVGSDVILGLYSKNLVLKKNNLIKTMPSKNRFHTLIVKPNFGCSTKKIFSKLKEFSRSEFHLVSDKMLSTKFLKKRKNDLEKIVFNEYPRLKNLKNFLENLSNIEFVRMTGSGSAIIAYFSSFKKCKEAEKKVKKKFRNYWCKTSKTI